MKIPRSIKIKGKPWKVRIVKNLKDGDEPCSGLAIPDDRTIKIDKDAQDQLWVFFHEYTHAMLFESGVSRNTGGLAEIVEEIICDSVADAFIEFLDKGKKK